MKKLYILFSLFFSLVLASCEKPATIPLPEAKPKAVVMSFLCPEEEYIRVSVTVSKPLYNQPKSFEFPIVPNAIITITDNLGNTSIVPFHPTRLEYQLEQSIFPLFPGRTYTLNVKFDNFEVSGATTIPVTMVPIKEAKGDLQGVDQFGQLQFAFSTKWDDAKGEKNYYRIAIDEKFGFSPWDTNYSLMSDQFQSDEYQDGKEMFSRGEAYDYGEMQNEYYFDIYLLTTDYNYYEFNKRRVNYFGDDPFSEPLPMYSNMAGGLGVVGSFRRTSFPVTIKK
jgi:hypothetical protein